MFHSIWCFILNVKKAAWTKTVQAAFFYRLFIYESGEIGQWNFLTGCHF